MALIGEIRKRSWILVFLLGLGMFGFILMDMLGQGGGGSLFSSNDVGSIGGKKISIPEFQNAVDQAGQSGSIYQTREGVWNQLVRKQIISSEADALGVSVSEEEMDELTFGQPNQISPLIQQFFRGQNGQFDQNIWQQYKQALDAGQFPAELMPTWNNLLDQIKLTKLEEKINNIVSKSIYTPNWMAEMEHASDNQTVDLRFVGIPFSSIQNDEVAITDSELSSYISENRAKYTNEDPTVNFDFVEFEVIPTVEDSAAIRGRLNEIIDRWGEKLTEISDSQFVVNSSTGDIKSTYDNQVYSLEDQLSPAVADTMMEIPVGTILSPYIEGSQYKIAKLVDRKVIPDSVQSRHILIGVTPDQANPQATLAAYDAAQVTADSIADLMNSGAGNWQMLNDSFSTDQVSKAKGGDLGTVDINVSFVPEFKNHLFFTGTQGKYEVVRSQFGVHVIHIQRQYKSGKLGAKVAYLYENIIPTIETEKKVYREAQKFAATVNNVEELTEKAQAAKLEVKTTTVGAKRNDYRILNLGSGTSTVNLVKWAFDASVGEVSQNAYEYDNVDAQGFSFGQSQGPRYVSKYVVAGLRSKSDGGLASVDDVRAEVESFVRNQKKAAKIIDKLDKTANLDALASTFSTTVQTASGITFNGGATPGQSTAIATEPKVIAAAFKQALNQKSEPIIGNTAVYIIEPTFKSEPSAASDLPAIRQKTSQKTQSQVSSQVYQSLLKSTTVKDKRYRFYN